MKKVVVIVLLVLLFLTACTGTPDDNIIGCGPVYDQERSLEAYNEYIAETDLPETFIPYSRISFLGAFEEFAVSKPAHDSKHTTMYYLRDENNFAFQLYISYEARFDAGIIPETHIPIVELPSDWYNETGSMRRIDTQDKEREVYYVRDGIAYLYKKGTLYAIVYIAEDYFLRVIGSHIYEERGIRYYDSVDFTKYSANDETSFISRLLSTDAGVAKGAIAEFEAAAFE